MKLVVAVVQDRDSQAVTGALVKHGYRVTKVSSTGGFLKRGNATLLIGCEDSMVESLVTVIRNACEPVAELVIGSPTDTAAGMPTSVAVRGSTVFVIEVERYERL